MKSAIAYIRVSTDKQGRSGLGIEAQQSAINAFVAAHSLELIDVFVEIETGKGSDALKTRPQLATALEIARVTGATVIAAKLDRITRDVHFGSGLFGRGDVAFKICDMPNADNFQINIMLSVAQLEREMISKRTRDALAAARERGVKLGGGPGASAMKTKATAFAESLRSVLAPVMHLSLREIASHLNAAGIKSATGGAWSAGTVTRVMERLA